MSHFNMNYLLVIMSHQKKIILNLTDQKFFDAI